MARNNKKTNPSLLTLIGDLKAQTRSNGAPLWRDVALRLESSRSNWAEPNLSRLSRHAADEDLILVPGKLLGSGAAGVEVVTINDLMKANPTGKGVFILG